MKYLADVYETWYRSGGMVHGVMAFAHGVMAFAHCAGVLTINYQLFARTGESGHFSV